MIASSMTTTASSSCSAISPTQRVPCSAIPLRHLRPSLTASKAAHGPLSGLSRSLACRQTAAATHSAAQPAVSFTTSSTTTTTTTTSSSSRRVAGVVVAAGKGFGATSSSSSKGAGSKGNGAAAAADKKCACGSGKAFKDCCDRYISGRLLAPTPEALLRARFTAYALGKVDYLVATTHPANPEHTGSERSYRRTLQRTAQSTQFIKLTVLDNPPSQQQQQEQEQPSAQGEVEGSEGGEAVEERAELSFKVRYKPREAGAREEEAVERSLFVKQGGAWLYRDLVD